MKHLDAPTDASLHDEECAAQDALPRTLHLIDVVHESIIIDGLPISATVEVWLTRANADAPPVVDSIEIRGGIYIDTCTMPHASGFSVWGDFLRLYETDAEFQAKSPKASKIFEAAVEALALKQALAAADHAWTIEDD